MSTEHAMRETVEALQARFEKDEMAYHDRYRRFTDWHWKKWRDVSSQLNEQCKAALAAPESDQESPEGQIDSNEKAMRSVAAEMHEACRAMNDDGDPTLCEKLKCPHYGEPNGCNSPTGEYRSVRNSAAMCQALRDIAAICDGGDTGGLPERILIYNLAKVALSAPAKNRELYATCSETANVQRDALRKIKGLFRDIDLTIDCPENEAYAIADKALSKPPRQCDVGTADEQLSRFVAAWESAHRSFVDRRSMVMLSVFSRWAQTPYVAEQKGEGDGSK